MKLAVIGGGNMGMAMINAWLNKKVIKFSDLIVFDRNPEKLESLNSRHGGEAKLPPRWTGKIPVMADRRNSKLKTSVNDFSQLSKFDVVVLAVKPQDMSGLLEDIKAHLSKKTIVLSIVAGIAIKHITSILGKSKIVRAMPNIPIQINAGIIGWTADNLISNDKKTVQKLLGAMGHEIYFADENKLNAVTAISGSGSAYVFYFMEALFEAAHKIGLTNQESASLTLGTFLGSVLMVNMSGLPPEQLRKKVTSKKGTTEVAINEFDKKKLKKIVLDGVKAAHKRARELNR